MAMAIVANDSTTALVVFRTDEDCDLAARAAVVHAVTRGGLWT
jgi:hypothetical protein